MWKPSERALEASVLFISGAGSVTMAAICRSQLSSLQQDGMKLSACQYALRAGRAGLYGTLSVLLCGGVLSVVRAMVKGDPIF